MIFDDLEVSFSDRCSVRLIDQTIWKNVDCAYGKRLLSYFPAIAN